MPNWNDSPAPSGSVLESVTDKTQSAADRLRSRLNALNSAPIPAMSAATPPSPPAASVPHEASVLSPLPTMADSPPIPRATTGVDGPALKATSVASSVYLPSQQLRDGTDVEVAPGVYIRIPRATRSGQAFTARAENGTVIRVHVYAEDTVASGRNI